MGGRCAYTIKRCSRTARSRARQRACSLALALALCGLPLQPLVALADDDPTVAVDAPDGASEGWQGEDLGDGQDAQEGDFDLDSSSSASPSPSSGADSPSGADSDGATDSGLEPPSGTDGAEDALDGAAPDAVQEGAPAAAADETAPAESGQAAPSSESRAKKADAKARKATQSKIEGKMTKAQQIAELRAQAQAVAGQMLRMEAELSECQAECDMTEQSLEHAKSASKEKRKLLKKSRKQLDALREHLSDYVVGMYKQGGVTPYLDALLGSTSYREFLSAWYMLDEVSVYGKRELHEHVEAVEALEAEAGVVEKQVEDAEKVAHEARIRLNRAKVTYLSLAPHVARLNREAAELSGDAAAAVAAQSEYEAARAVLDAALEESSSLGTKLEGEGIFNHPCPDADYSSGFGYRTFDNSYHLGLDMAIGEGTPYYAADDGVVTDATSDGGYNGGAGNWIVIDHGNGVVTKYMHSLTTFVKPGDRVVRGQAIGLVGNTGNSFGAHLHFQVELDGTAVDPTMYLDS